MTPETLVPTEAALDVSDRAREAIPVEFYQWLYTIERDVRVWDLTPNEIGGLLFALATPPAPVEGVEALLKRVRPYVACNPPREASFRFTSDWKDAMQSHAALHEEIDRTITALRATASPVERDLLANRALVEAGPLIARLRRTKTERLMRPAFGGIMLDMGEEREAPINPDGPEAADLIERLLTALSTAAIQGDDRGDVVHRIGEGRV